MRHSRLGRNCFLRILTHPHERPRRPGRRKRVRPALQGQHLAPLACLPGGRANSGRCGLMTHCIAPVAKPNYIEQLGHGLAILTVYGIDGHPVSTILNDHADQLYRISADQLQLLVASLRNATAVPEQSTVDSPSVPSLSIIPAVGILKSSRSSEDHGCHQPSQRPPLQSFQHLPIRSCQACEPLAQTGLFEEQRSVFPSESSIGCVATPMVAKAGEADNRPSARCNTWRLRDRMTGNGGPDHHEL